MEANKFKLKHLYFFGLYIPGAVLSYASDNTCMEVSDHLKDGAKSWLKNVAAHSWCDLKKCFWVNRETY